jgi:very-short-patch-repair endonuclease
LAFVGSDVMRDEPIRGASRAVRKEMTPAERQLWNGLRGWKLGKFRRQHPLGRFVLDFYSVEHRLCIEVDGAVHDAQPRA